MKTIAIITGASSGLGEEFTRQISQKYAENYDEIWIIARRTEKLQKLAEEINSTKNFNIIKPVTLDICGKDGVLQFKQLLEEENNKLKVFESKLNIGLLINNAGFGTYGPFAETSPMKEMEMVDLNCTSLTGMCGVSLPYMTKGSVIINTASLAAYLPLGNFAVYGASKAYVLNFSIALAAELKDKGIKVCALCPGSVSTEFANVASNGARPVVKGGIPAKKVIEQCLRRAFRGKKTSLYRLKWRITAFFSRFIGRYFGARFTYKNNPRPRTPDADMIKEEISVDNFN
ncbi:MAG: SDR family NAD(P)-dependent oxidoreductase [Treponema sp.]|nr:SDR family NAD(P)-dependent oxidoreductase [Treponema sp.]